MKTYTQNRAQNINPKETARGTEMMTTITQDYEQNIRPEDNAPYGVCEWCQSPLLDWGADCEECGIDDEAWCDTCGGSTDRNDLEGRQMGVMCVCEREG